MVATSSNAWASSIQTPRTVQWIWWVCCGCRCFSGDSMDLEHLLSQAIRISSFFFPRFSKKSPDSHPPSPNFATKSSSLERPWLDMKFMGSCDRKEWDPLENSGHKGSQGLWPMEWPEASGLNKFPANWDPEIYRVPKRKGREKNIIFLKGKRFWNFRGGYVLFSHFFGGEMIQFNLMIFFVKNRLKPPGRKSPEVEVFVVQDFSEKSIHSQLMSWLLMIEITCRTVGR